MIIADTSGLLAALDPDEQHHARCRAVVESAANALVVSPFVLCELDHLVLQKLGPDAEAALLGDVASGAYQLAGMGPGDVAAARDVVMQYRDLHIGLAVASVAVLAQRHRTCDVFTLDERHFRAMQTKGGGSYRLLPADS